MKKLLMALIIALTAILSTSAMAQRFEQGQYYSQRGGKAMSCQFAGYNNRGQCMKYCEYKNWYSYYGAEYGYVSTGYGWQLVQQTRTWWAFEWANGYFRCN